MFPRPTYKQLFPVRRGRLDIPNPIPHFIFWCPKFSVYEYQPGLFDCNIDRILEFFNEENF